MDISGLQRSTTSFRRQGSSGLIWDDKFLQGDLNRMIAQEEEEKQKASGSSMQRSRSDGGRAYRSNVKVSPPRADPPSPKASGCGICGIFGKPAAAGRKPKPNKRKFK